MKKKLTESEELHREIVAAVSRAADSEKLTISDIVAVLEGVKLDFFIMQRERWKGIES